MISTSPPRRTRVAILYGGRSAEHEISLISARFVARNLDPARFDVVPIGITQEGRWMLPAGGLEALEAEEIHGEPVVPEADRQLLRRGSGEGALTADTTDTASPITPSPPMEQIDVVFPVLHGPFGEDGTMQGLLELAGVPYVGAGVVGSSVAMDKDIARRILTANDLEVTPGRVLTRPAFDRIGARTAVGRLLSELALPLFVKPANGGSSVGIHRVSRAESLLAALEDAFQYDRKLVVEQGVDGREIECAVLGND